LYSARYKLSGQTKITTIALHVSDRQVAEAKLREILRELEREAIGICVPRSVRLACQCGVEEHVKAYCSDLRARRKDEDYVTTVEKRLTKLINECQWQSIGDVTAESFQTWREKQKLAPKTLNDYLGAASALFAWLIRNEVTSRNPLRCVGRVEVRGKERLKRRAFTPEEFASVIAVAGEYRLALLTAYYTGLRRGELGQLQWADVLRKPAGTFIVVRAATAKNRLTKALYVPAWFARELVRSKPTGAAECDLVLPADKVPSIWAFRTL
jgi:integrase